MKEKFFSLKVLLIFFINLFEAMLNCEIKSH